MPNNYPPTILCGLVIAVSASAAVPTSYKTTKIDGLTIAYREAGDPASPKLVLLHPSIRRWGHATFTVQLRPS